jgi:hypothetical protein
MTVRFNKGRREPDSLDIDPAVLVFPNEPAGEGMFREQIWEPPEVVHRHQDVEIVMRSSLPAEQCVHTPATHHPAADVVALKQLAERRRVPC